MNDRLHVFQVTKSTGGVGEYMRWILKGLDKRRFRLTVACLSEGGSELAAELSRLPGVQAFSLALNRYIIDPLSDSRACTQLARLIRRGDFDLVHAHGSKPGFLARLAAAGTGVPVIYSPHCFAFHAGAGRTRAALIAAVERFAARYWTTRIMTVSEGERELARRYRVGRDGQFVTVQTGIDLRPYDAPVDRAAVRASLGVPAHATLVGTVGRLNPQKAPLDFVRAAAHLHSRCPEVHFVWVGAGPLEAQVREAVAAQGLREVFHFAGQRRDITDLMRALDYFVTASLWEGLPLTVLEAMAAGIPVVATRIMGTCELVVDGKTGVLVPPSDPAALARALLDLLADPARARRFGACGRQHVAREFTCEQMLTRIAQVYEEVGGRPARPMSRFNPLHRKKRTGVWYEGK